MSSSAQFTHVSDSARFSLLTCTPGNELYSVFGHSAIRIQDRTEEGAIDWVYNYGTFRFSDDFYWKFARGKLDYMLAKTNYYYFEEEYTYSLRGIQEQVLQLTPAQGARLFELLEENYEPKNKYYRYDFFYDNCATRIRDIIGKACGDELKYTYVYPREYTFRQAIQNYLDYMPWSDFGIDLALGMPCDRVMGKGDGMFLPDSMMKEFHFAALGNGTLTTPAKELLPQRAGLDAGGWYTPSAVFGILLFVSLAFGYWRMRKGKQMFILDRAFLLTSGLVGVMVVFLWFFTDHSATKWNLNLLWANPLNLILAFSGKGARKGWRMAYLKCYSAVLCLTLLTWFFLPQRMHIAVIPILLGLLFYAVKQVRPSMISGEKLV